MHFQGYFSSAACPGTGPFLHGQKMQGEESAGAKRTHLQTRGQNETSRHPPAGLGGRHSDGGLCLACLRTGNGFSGSPSSRGSLHRDLASSHLLRPSQHLCGLHTHTSIQQKLMARCCIWLKHLTESLNCESGKMGDEAKKHPKSSVVWVLLL